MGMTLGQQIPSNTIMTSASLNLGSIPDTESPPPGYLSEDGDPMDQNDNMSELVSWQKKILENKNQTYTFTYKLFFAIAFKLFF